MVDGGCRRDVEAQGAFIKTGWTLVEGDLRLAKRLAMGGRWALASLVTTESRFSVSEGTCEGSGHKTYLMKLL
jgi:hypothetical protein